MIIPPAVIHKFSHTNNFVLHVGDKVKDILLAYCEAEGYAFVSRFKTLESLAEKIESGRYDGWSSLDDVYAATVIVPSVSHEPGVLSFLQKRFKEVALRRRGTSKKAPDVFRFDATRFIGSLDNGGPSDRAPEIDRIRFEIQIRTAFEHAWSVTTHALVYKSDVVDWRRLRLVAQLKAAVEQLDTLVLAFDASAPSITESQWPEVAMRRQIADAFKLWLTEGTLPEELAPKDWSRFSENILEMMRAGLPRRQLRSESVEKALGLVNSELKELGFNRVPRSVSLFQLTLGILAKRKVLNSQFDDFVPNVTKELSLLYPEVRHFTPAFNYEDL